MKIKSVLNQNLFIDYDILYDTGEHISSSLAGADGTLQALNGLMGQIAALVSGVPAKARCASLQASCLKAQSEIQGIDLNSYGNRASRSLYLLADRSQSVDREIAKNLSHNIGAMGFLKNEINGLVKEAAFRSYRDRSSLLLMGSSQRAENDEKNEKKETSEEEHPYSLIYEIVTVLGISLSESGVPYINNAVDARDYTQVMCLSLYGEPGEEVEIHRNGNTYIFRLSSMTFDDAVDAQCNLTNGAPTIYNKSNKPVFAAREAVYRCMNPCNYLNGDSIYQFLDLSYDENRAPSVEEAKEMLAGQGALEGREETFLNAGKNNDVDPRYLIGHAILETGHGTSELATGCECNGVTVYNVYGYGANDNNAVEDGAKTAFNYGWFDIEKAIEGGAEKIAKGYTGNGQNTLYDMRWNSPNPATHQYATDVEWIIKQTSFQQMPEIYADIEGGLQFCIPVYMSERNENR